MGLHCWALVDEFGSEGSRKQYRKPPLQSSATCSCSTLALGRVAHPRGRAHEDLGASVELEAPFSAVNTYRRLGKEPLG